MAFIILIAYTTEYKGGSNCETQRKRGSTVNQEAMVYLNEALDIIQKHSVRREHIDWQALRQEVSLLADEAKTPAETYPAIERALALLDDHHSMFSSPEKEKLLDEGKLKRVGLRCTFPEGTVGMIDPGSPAERTDIRVGDQVITINGHSLSDLRLEQFQRMLGKAQFDLTFAPADQGSPRAFHLQAEPYEALWLPEGKRIDNIGYIALPGFLAGTGEHRKAYATMTQKLIRDMDQSVSSWVVDLRRTVGGSMWPMWAGIGPLLGEGTLVEFVAPGDNKLTAIYLEGKAIMEPGGHIIDAVDEPYTLQYHPQIAVLTSPLTTSAGEFVSLSFRGRPQIASFGEPTCGVPTANNDFRLSDGALLFLTTHLGVDVTGQTYGGPIAPDHLIKIDWSQIGTKDDRVLQAAIQWLHGKTNHSIDQQ
jgi:carboxyl-terminal processing protease